jgi:hypothetical protein
MAPAYRDADLALVHREAAYGVGDIVAYRDPRVGVVMHRIVAIEAGHYVTRGDNRNRGDSYRPQEADILGRAIGRWPGGLRFILTVTSVPGLALLAGAAALIVFALQPSTNEEAARHPRGSRRRRQQLPS